MTKYIIDFINTASLAEIEEYLVANEATVITIFSRLDRVALIECANEPGLSPIVESIINDDDTIATVQKLDVVPVYPVPSDGEQTVSVADQKDWWKVYSMSSADFSKPAISYPRLGKMTNIYMVDSGIDLTHPEFAGKKIDLIYSLTGEFVDTVGHGTALSSLVVGNTCGIVDAELKIVKIFDEFQQTRQSDFLYAFDAILADAEASDNLFSVVNLSWSITKNTYIENKIQTLINAGLAVVTASGNTGQPIAEVTPPDMADVFTIGSYGPNFIPSDFTSYSDATSVSLHTSPTNSGALDSWAPGEKIWAASLDGNCGYCAGTSMSAAIYSATLLYNVSQLITDNNDVLFMYRLPNGNINWEKLTSTDRPGLLLLTDPKYATSANKICTFVITKEATATELAIMIPMQRGQIDATVGQVGWNPFYILNTISSYEMITTLPDYITLDKHIMVARPTVDPTADIGTEIVTIQYRVTPIDGSAPITCSMTVVISTAAAAPPAPVPPDDPLIPSLILNSKK